MLTRYEVNDIQGDGSGYVILFFDDDESCGQHFHGAPVGDLEAFEKFIEKEIAPKAEAAHRDPGVVVISTTLMEQVDANKQRGAAILAEEKEERRRQEEEGKDRGDDSEIEIRQ